MPLSDPLLFSDPVIATTVLVVVIFGSIVQAGLGMGFGLTVAPVLALIDPALVPVAVLYLGMITAVAAAVSERSAIVWREVGIGMMGRTAGIVLGTWVLLQLDDRALFSLVFGCLILVAVSFSAIGLTLALNQRNLLGMGVISGFMGVITSVGAPPLALIYQNRIAKSARPTLGTFFALGGLFSLMSLYATGYAGLDDLWMALVMLPASLFGTWLGQRLRGRFDTRYRPALLIMAATASALLIWRGVSG
ncbi:MAG: sulfite exporter TauE/SafE family protein [Ahrensia sp.]|nr:sulfite exporter TauE/SafE family protein [Ahrensia sp.]